MLSNLLSNAAKFTADGQITFSVRLDAGPVEAGKLRHFVFEIQDTGIGMTETQTRQLFQPFVQVDSGATRLFGGSGLGLVISRRLCDLMNGDVSVVSEPGKGSVFTVRIPIEAKADSTIGR